MAAEKASFLYTIAGLKSQLKPDFFVLPEEI
jgi:hypothetical protein